MKKISILFALENIFLALLVIIYFSGMTPPVGIGLMIYGDSMEPTLCTGDIVIYSDYTQIEKGDIITYKNDAVYTTHRVVNETVNGYWTKGDNSTLDPEPIQEEQVIGEVVFRLSFCG